MQNFVFQIGQVRPGNSDIVFRIPVKTHEISNQRRFGLHCPLYSYSMRRTFQLRNTYSPFFQNLKGQKAHTSIFGYISHSEIQGQAKLM